MQITPSYDGAPILTIEGDVADQREPLVRQRDRLAATLAGLTPDQWAAESRCEGWSVQDVVAHLVGTNQFWVASIRGGVAGEPTRILSAFDPVATPALLVDAVRSQTPAETLEQFVASNAALARTIDALADDDWLAIAESPVGHVSVRSVAHHALWDAWVHERDVCLPLGLVPGHETDEIVSSLRYVAALAPTFASQQEPERRGALVIDASDPDARVVVEVGETIVVHDGRAPADALTLTGPAVDLVDALSIRGPLRQAVPDDQRWLLEGLAQVFDGTLELG